MQVKTSGGTWATVQSWGEDNDWGTQWIDKEVQMSSACRCRLSTKQGESSKVAQVLGHQFSAPSSLANQAGARGNNTPTIGTNKSTNDSHRAHSPDYDSVHAVGLKSSGQQGEDHSQEPDGGSGP
jgi:hypothetical protein